MNKKILITMLSLAALVAFTPACADKNSDDGADANGDGDGDGDTFLPQADMPPAIEECDVWAQDCPDGEKCVPGISPLGGGAWDVTICVMLMGDGQVGDSCTFLNNDVGSGQDTCGEGKMCWDTDAMSGEGTCIGICQAPETNPSCEDSNASCGIFNDGKLPICLPGCDPFLQDCNNQLCLPNDLAQKWGCVLDASGEEGQYGDPCEFANACDPGLLCINVDVFGSDCGSTGCCSPICDTTGNGAECSMNGQDCITFYAEGETPWPGFENVGLCQIPA